MLVCFTIGELYALGAKLQVAQTPGWSNNPQEAARDIVRHFERSGALAFLVEALREAKPLVEWPEPLPLPVPPAPPPAASPPAASPPAFAPTETGAGGAARGHEPRSLPDRPAPTAPGRSASAVTAIAGSPSSAAAAGASSSGAAGAAAQQRAAGVAGGSTILGVPAPQALEYADTALEAPTGDRPTPITDVPAAMLVASTRGASTPPAAPLPSTDAGPGFAPTTAGPGFAPAVMPKPGEQPPLAPLPPKANSASPVGQGASGLAPSGGASSGMAPSGEASSGMAPSGGGSPGMPTSGLAPSGEASSGMAPSGGPAFSAAALPPPGPTQAMPSSETLQDPMRPGPASRPVGAWPGTASGAPRREMPNPWILMGAGTVVLLVLIGIAFLAGRASSATEAASGTTTSGAPAVTGDHVFISQIAADALGTSLSRVAKACQIDPSSLRGRSLFEAAYTRCGPPGLPQGQGTSTGPRNTGYDPLPEPSDPTEPADPDPSPTPGKKGTKPAAKSTKPQTADTPPPPTSGGGGGGCLTGCARSHSQCTSRCGAEPQQGSQYDAYQSCLSGCLKALSQCKMGCN